MSLNRVIWGKRVSIVCAVHSAIVHGMLDTWNRCKIIGTSPYEPDFVGGLVLESCPRIHASLKPIFSRYNIQSSMLAVYCHQTPKVTYSGMAGTSCELGDLLFVHVHKYSTGHVRRNALLYQAKVSSSRPCRVPKGDFDQLKLYSEWPEFEYRSSPLTGKRRSITPKMIHAGAQYMLIDGRMPNHPHSGLLGLPGTYPIGSCMPGSSLYDHNDLAVELFELLIGHSGRPFADYAHSSRGSDWSRVVWDLLDVGVRKAFNRKRSGRYQSPRTAGDVSIYDGLSFTQTTSPLSYSTVTDIIGPRSATLFLSSDNFGSPSDEERHDEMSEPESGVSIILLETSTL